MKMKTSPEIATFNEVVELADILIGAAANHVHRPRDLEAALLDLGYPLTAQELRAAGTPLGYFTDEQKTLTRI